MKKTRLLVLLGLVLCLLLTACAAFAEDAPAAGQTEETVTETTAEETPAEEVPVEETPTEETPVEGSAVVVDGFTLDFPWEGNTSECMIAGADDSLIQDGVLVLPEKLGDYNIRGYRLSLINGNIRILVRSQNCDLYKDEEEAPDSKLEYYVIRYKNFSQLSESDFDRAPDIQKGEYALTDFYREVINRNGKTDSSWSSENILMAGEIPDNIFGAKAYNLIDPSNIALEEDGWQYTLESSGDKIDVIGYAGAADSALVVPETIAGHAIDDIYLSAVPSGVEYLYLPYRVYVSTNRSAFAEGEQRSIVLISYISYANAGDYSSSLYKDENFKEGSYAGTDIRRYTYSASGSESDHNEYFPAEVILSEINGAPFVPGDISRYITYTSGEFTYCFRYDDELYLLNGSATDKENAWFFPSFVDGRLVEGVSLSEIPANISEFYVPYRASFNYPTEASANGLTVYTYIDYDIAQQEESSWIRNMSIQPGELYLYNATIYKNGNSDRLVLDYCALPVEINGMPIRSGLGKDSIKTYTSGNYTYYKKTETEICICGFSDTEARKVNIPSTIDGLTVTAIASLNNSDVFSVNKAEEITLPSTLKILGDNALHSWNSKKLNKLILPEGLKEIGSNAIDLYYLKEITIPASVERLGSQAFAYTNISKITIPGNIKVIPSNLFYSCYKLSSVTLCEGTTTIEEEAFYGRNKLKSINIPASVTSIGKNAFNSCSRLGKVTFAGTGIKRIEDGTFADCKALAKLDLPEGIESIGYQAFYGTKLGQLNLPSTLKNIESSAFGSCKGLSKVTGGTGLESIADDAFVDCKPKLLFVAAEGSYLQRFAESRGFVFKPAK